MTELVQHTIRHPGIADVANIILRLAHEADQLAEAGDIEALGHGLADLREFRRALTDLERHVETHVADLMQEPQVNLGDDLVLERRKGADRKNWQSVELLRHLVGDQIVDVRTGENVFDLLCAVLPLTGSLGWRTKALRERGVDPDEWAEVRPGRVSVSVQRSNQ